jgi:biotin carboxylase
LNRKKLLILGSGRWHLPLFIRAKELGLYIIATDITSDLVRAPGLKYADEAHVIDVRDVERNLALAVEKKIDGIITGVDLGVPTVAHIAAELGLPGISSAAAHACTDKAQMRNLARSAGLAVPQFSEITAWSELVDKVAQCQFPLVLKPADNCGSRGVAVVQAMDQLQQSFHDALAHSFSKRILLEEFMRGTECSVEGFVESDRTFRILGISDKLKSQLPYRYDLELHYPASFDSWQMNAIEEYVGRLVKAFGITMGFVHTELMISTDPQTPVRLIETAARGCGAFVVGKLLPEITGVDIIGAFIRQALGEHVILPPFQSRSGLLKFILAPVGKVLEVRGLAAAREIPGVIDLDIDLKPGDEIRRAQNTAGRNGYLLAAGNSREQVDFIAEAALKQLAIVMECANEL